MTAPAFRYTEVVRAYVAVLVFVACSGVFVNDVTACSCSESSSCQRLGSASAVFVGEVLEVSKGRQGRVARIRVLRSWKGQPAEIVTVSTPWDEGMCGVAFRPGERRLVYASGTERNLGTSICDGGGVLAPDKPVPEMPTAGRVSGFVAERPLERIDQSRRDGSDPSLPVRSGRAWLEIAGGRQGVAIVDGRFQFDGVGPGRGEIRFELDGALESRPQVFTIVDVTDCAEVFALAVPAGRVGGWARTADGSVAAGVHLQLVPPADTGKVWSLSGDDATTDESGRFEFSGLRPGGYMLRVSGYAGPSGRHPHAVVYYPGVPDPAGAAVIAVGRQREFEAPFVLPLALPTRELTVRVTCRDGSIPPIVRLNAAAQTNPPQHGDDSWSERGSGSATLRLLRDVPYRVEVTASFPLPPPDTQFKPELLRVVDLEAGPDPNPVEVVAPHVECAPRPRE